MLVSWSCLGPLAFLLPKTKTFCGFPSLKDSNYTLWFSWMFLCFLEWRISLLLNLFVKAGNDRPQLYYLKMKLTAITRIYDRKWKKMIKIIYDRKWEKIIKIDEVKNSCPMQCLILKSGVRTTYIIYNRSDMPQKIYFNFLFHYWHQEICFLQQSKLLFHQRHKAMSLA
jgi:hypothetical protein